MVIKKRNKFFAILMLIVSVFFIQSCDNKASVNPAQESPFDVRAGQIQSRSAGITSNISNDGQFVTTIYNVSELLKEPSPSKGYEIAPEMFLNIPPEEDHGALYATGFMPIRQNVLLEIDMTVPLDSIWQNTREKHPEILQQFYIHKDSFIRVYPYMDLTKIYKPKQDLKKLKEFQDALINKERIARTKWSEPTWDPVFNEMVLTATYPIRLYDELIGVVGCKVSLNKLFENKTGKEEVISGIATMDGSLIIANPGLYTSMGMKVPETIANPKQIAFNEDLRKSSNPNMKSLITGLLNSPKTNYRTKLAGKVYYVECQFVPELNWVIFKLNDK